MSTSKLTETLDIISDKAFGFNKASSEPVTKVHETASVAHYEDKTETLETAHLNTAEYPTVEDPVERFTPEPAPAYSAGGEHAVSPDPYPQPPLNPPTEHPVAQGRSKPVLKTGPEQDFTVSIVAGFMGVLSLLLMFNSAGVGLLAIVFGVTAVYYGRKTERAGISAGLGKTLGWFSFLGGIIALFAVAFFLLIALIVTIII